MDDAAGVGDGRNMYHVVQRFSFGLEGIPSFWKYGEDGVREGKAEMNRTDPKNGMSIALTSKVGRYVHGSSRRTRR